MVKPTTATSMLGCAAFVVLAGCSIDPRNYETAPVQVETAQGVVTCQLYTRDTVIWDRATAVPAGMSIPQADEVCKAEGRRQLSK